MDDLGIVLKNKTSKVDPGQAWGTMKKDPPLEEAAVQVTVSGPVMDAIDRYAAGDTGRELGGVLLGDYCEKKGIFRVRVDAAIKALHTEAARSNIKFTHKTWETIELVRNEKYSHLKVVGWFHTHPGLGVFLSEHDRFIHRNFFDLPFQVAYVVDPIARESGFFGWNGSRVTRVPCRVERRVKKITRPAGPAKTEKKVKQWPLIIAFVLTMVLLVVASGLNVIQHERAGEFRADAMALSEEREQLLVEVSRLRGVISEQEEALEHSREVNDRAMASLAELRAIVTQQRFPGLSKMNSEAEEYREVPGR